MIKIKNKEYKVIDAHLHLPWQDKYSTIEAKYNKLQDEMRENSIDYGLLIANSLLESNIGNNEQCLNMVTKSNNLFLIFGFSPLERIDEQLEYAEKLIKQKKIVGIKLYPGHEDFSMNDIRISNVIKLCIKYDIPLVVHTEWNDDYYPQYSHPYFIKQLAETYQDLRIVCCHIWVPRVIESFKITSKLTNVFYDISAFGMGEAFLKENPDLLFPKKEKAIQYLHHVMSVCPSRVMFGSDFGSLKINDHIDIVLESSLNENEISKLLYENAKTIYNLDNV